MRANAKGADAGQALRQVRQARRLEPRFADAWLAEATLLLPDEAAAERLLQAGRLRASGDPRLTVMAASRPGLDATAAWQLLEEGLGQPGPSPLVLATAAASALKAGEARRAAELYAELSRDPSFLNEMPWPRLAVGALVAELAAGRPPRAREVLRFLLRLDRDREFMASLPQALAEASPEPQLEAFVALGSDLEAPLRSGFGLVAAEVCLVLQQADRALEALPTDSTLAPLETRIRHLELRVEALRQQQKWAQVVAAIDQARRSTLLAEQPGVLYLAALVAFEWHRDPLAARELLDQALDQDPGLVPALVLLTVLHFQDPEQVPAGRLADRLQRGHDACADSPSKRSIIERLAQELAASASR